MAKHTLRCRCLACCTMRDAATAEVAKQPRKGPKKAPRKGFVAVRGTKLEGEVDIILRDERKINSRDLTLAHGELLRIFLALDTLLERRGPGISREMEIALQRAAEQASTELEQLGLDTNNLLDTGS